MVGTLYLVATPIGNLEDISPRALRILGSVRLVAAEDTRHTRKLFNHYNIQTPLTSYHEHNKVAKLAPLLEALEQGDLALVSDAGTPGINDPGYELVRAALQAGHSVCPVPGPSAPIAALAASGLPADAFLYLGYLPRKPAERQRLLHSVSQLPYTLVLLEAPHRLLGALQDLEDILGDRSVALARELTKLHEEILRGKLSEVRSHFTDQAPRGEFTLVVAGSPPDDAPWNDARLRQALEQGRQAGMPASRLARQVAAASGWPRSRVYSLIKEIDNPHESG